MRIALKYLPAVFTVAAAAIVLAPVASADTGGVTQPCATAGGSETVCASPGTMEYPWGGGGFHEYHGAHGFGGGGQR